MRCAGVARALAAIALAGGAADVEATSLTGTAGLGTERTDTSSSAGSVTAPAWDAFGTLQLSDLPVERDLLDARLRTSYDTHHSLYAPSPTSASGWTFEGSGALLSASPVSLTLSGARRWSDTAVGREGARVGEQLATTYAGGALIAFDRLPRLSMTLTRNDSTSQSLSAPDVTASTTLLHAGAGQTVGPFRYSASYDTSWNEGSSNQSNYRSHDLGVDADADVSEHLKLGAADHYYLRLPTVDAPYNPRLDGHELTVLASLRAVERWTGSATYHFSHLLAEASEVPTTEVASNAVGLQAGYQLDASWLLRASATLTGAEERSGATRRRATAESVGAGANWERELGPLALRAWGDGSLGVVQPYAAGTSLSYAASADLDVGTARGEVRANGGYGVSYQKNGAALVGSALAHRANARVARSWPGATLSARLAGEWTTREDALLGTTHQRSLTFTGSLTCRHASVNLYAGHVEGRSERLGGTGIDPGLLPDTFNTTSRYLSLSASSKVAGVLLSLAGGLSTSTAPELGREWEGRLSLSAAYTWGRFQFRVEDQYTVAGVADQSRRGNLFIARASRSFELL